MNTVSLCTIALLFLSHHVARFDRPVVCEMFTAADHDSFVVSGSMPRPWTVTVSAAGKPLSYAMPATTVASVAVLSSPGAITIIRPQGAPSRPATTHLYGGARRK